MKKLGSSLKSVAAAKRLSSSGKGQPPLVSTSLPSGLPPETPRAPAAAPAAAAAAPSGAVSGASDATLAVEVQQLRSERTRLQQENDALKGQVHLLKFKVCQQRTQHYPFCVLRSPPLSPCERTVGYARGHGHACQLGLR